MALRTILHSPARVLLFASCFAVLGATLTIGLWPFHAPLNQVRWLAYRNGVSYGRSGTVLSQGALRAAGIEAGAADGRSVEIWAACLPYQTTSTLLTFYSAQHPPFELKVSQALTDLSLRVNGSREPDLLVKEIFRHPAPRFLTIASGQRGLTIYAEGRPVVERVPGLAIPRSAFASQVIVGDSPGQADSWKGQVFGLALYQTELTGVQALQHFKSWTTNGAPAVSPDERNVALYLFDEHQGSVVHNRVKPSIDLVIPPRYEVAGKAFMEPFWEEFQLSRSFALSALRNIAGFVPLGFFLYRCLAGLRVRGAAGWTAAAGTLVSLTIEVLQWFLPTRDSGTSDIFTNTLGALIGAGTCRCANPYLTPVVLRGIASLGLQGRAKHPACS